MMAVDMTAMEAEGNSPTPKADIPLAPEYHGSQSKAAAAIAELSAALDPQ